jgi:membrane-associated phospholipid phosphatase
MMILLPVSTLRQIASALIARRSVVILLLSFTLVLLSLLWSAGQSFDASIFIYFNQHRFRTRLTDRLMFLVTQLGNGIVGFGLSAFFFFSGYRRLGIMVALGIITLWLMVEIIKTITDRTRPYLVIATTNLVGWRERGRSFPSGHTSQTFFIASLLAQHFHLNVWASLAIYALAIMVGFTRIYVGAHYPRDVLAGAVLGSVWGIMGVMLDTYLLQRAA